MAKSVSLLLSSDFTGDLFEGDGEGEKDDAMVRLCGRKTPWISVDRKRVGIVSVHLYLMCRPSSRQAMFRLRA